MDFDEYNYPVNDWEAYKKYPKLNWVYTTTRLLDAQNINWLPFHDDQFIYRLPAFAEPFGNTVEMSNNVYVSINGNEKFTHCAIIKGDVKWMAHSTNVGFEEEIIGEIDIRINAFVVLYLKKFTGFVWFRTCGGDITEVHLCPSKGAMRYYPEEALKLFKKCYPRKS